MLNKRKLMKVRKEALLKQRELMNIPETETLQYYVDMVLILTQGLIDQILIEENTGDK